MSDDEDMGDSQSSSAVLDDASDAKSDNDGFVVAASKTVNALHNKKKVGPEPAPKKINPRILILDFAAGVVNPMSLIRNALESKTQLKN